MWPQAAQKKGRELEEALLKASEGGRLPIICDTSPCLSQIKAGLADPSLRFRWGDVCVCVCVCVCVPPGAACAPAFPVLLSWMAPGSGGAR